MHGSGLRSALFCPRGGSPIRQFKFAAPHPLGYPTPVTGLADRDFFLIAVVIYGISTVYSVFLWRKGFRQDDRICYGVLAFGFVFHSTALIQRGFSLSRCPVNNLYEAIAFVMWTIMAAYLVIGAWHRLRFIGAFAAPILFGIGVFALMPALDVQKAQPEFASGALASLHASLILLSYGAFGISSVAAIMYLTQEHDLKLHKVRAVLARLPSIERLELIAGRILAAGFVLLTAGLSMAPFLMKAEYGVYLRPDPKIMWSVFVWVLYAGLLVARWWFSQRGRRFAWGNIGSFSFVLLTFWGVNLLSGVHHP